MARKKSLWSELQRERERRQRVAQAQERMNEQTIRQLQRLKGQGLALGWFGFEAESGLA
jgi:hypothetical protein